MGARINPEKGSKQEGLSWFKKRFGANLKQGYMWKYSLHPLKYRLYCLAARYRSGGDIVDEERHKLKDSQMIYDVGHFNVRSYTHGALRI